MQKNDRVDEVMLEQAQRVRRTKTAGETMLSDVTVLLTQGGHDCEERASF